MLTIEEYKQQITTQQKNIQRYNEEITKLNKEIKELETSVEEYKNMCSTIESTCNTLKNKINKYALLATTIVKVYDSADSEEKVNMQSSLFNLFAVQCWNQLNSIYTDANDKVAKKKKLIEDKKNLISLNEDLKNACEQDIRNCQWQIYSLEAFNI